MRPHDAKPEGLPKLSLTQEAARMNYAKTAHRLREHIIKFSEELSLLSYIDKVLYYMENGIKNGL